MRSVEENKEKTMKYLPLLVKFPLTAGSMLLMLAVMTAPLMAQGETEISDPNIVIELTEVDENWPLIRFLMDDPIYHATYVSLVNEIATGIFSVEKAQTRFQAEHDLISPHVVGPEGELPNHTLLEKEEDFYASLEIRKDHVLRRAEESFRFLSNENFVPPQIGISEIHYNPSSVHGDDDDYEFIELYNGGNSSLDVSGYSFTAGITFILPQETNIGPGEYLLIAKNANTYSSQEYQVYQWVNGNLSNRGEIIELVDVNGVMVDYVRYSDYAPWPTEPDGNGPTLELKSSSQVNYLYENWKASAFAGGTPGLPNSD